MVEKIEFRNLMEDLENGPKDNWKKYEGKILHINNIEIAGKAYEIIDGKKIAKPYATYPDRHFLWLKPSPSKSLEERFELENIERGDIIDVCGYFSTGNWLENHFLELDSSYSVCFKKCSSGDLYQN